MNATKKNDNFEGRLTVTSEELALFMGCGRKTAVDTGEKAGARVQIGRRVLWNIEKVREYLNKISM